MRKEYPLLTLALMLASCAHAADSLPSYKTDPSQTSVSGLSSGAYMAVQYQVAYSASVKGTGIVAGGPYYCVAKSSSYVGICMGLVPFVSPKPSLMLAAAREFEKSGQIDPLDQLKNSNIYIFSGTEDKIVRQKAVDTTVEFFKLAGVPEKQIRYVNQVPAGHAFITPGFGNDCAASSPPYINHCELKSTGYDQAGELLQHIYGPLKPPASSLQGKTISFSQREFADSASSMADTGYAYVPQDCAAGTSCKVHVALHGCMQSAESVGDSFYKNTGFNRWADSNHIIVLYPQVNKSTERPENPRGCWDWFGYSGPDYALKSGVQMKAIKAMVDRLGGR
jgi:predicted peptidase